jgi:membrane-associated phospholipid phosphatase
MLTNHRRAFGYALALIAALAFMLIAVGHTPAGDPTATAIPFVGTMDRHFYDWMGTIRNPVFSGAFRFLNVLGGGIVTIPLRALASLWLAFRRRWRAFFGFVLTWAVSELALTWLKASFDRGRPPHPLVDTVGASFPSGHAVAGAATAVALVLAFLPPGPKRRKWEWIAIGFAFVMAFSRVYLYAHWFSDVLAGVLLGAGIALGSFALVTEVRDIVFRRRGIPIPPPGG